MSILFTGSFQNETEPFWARAGQGGGGVGPDLQVSTLITNTTGFIGLQATGTLGASETASISFDRTDDVANPTPTLLTIVETIPLSGGTAVENVSVVNNTKTFYDPLAVGELIVYGLNTSVTNPVGPVGVITQYGTSTDMAIETTGLHISSLYISTINGETFPGGNLGPDAQFSTVNINPIGFVRFNAAGTSNAFLGGAMFFQKSPDIPQTYSQAIKMAPNTLGNILPAQIVENISITHTDDLKSPPGIYYDNLALGDLYVFGTNNIKSSPLGQVAVFQQFSTTTDVECVTTGFHTENLIVSSINGQAPNGGGGSGVNLTVSTIQVNPTGSISMRASGTLVSPETAEILFNPIPGAPGGNTASLAMNVTNTTTSAGVPATNQNVAFTRTTGFPLVTRFDEVAMGNLYIYGTTNALTSTIGQLGVLEQWSTTSTDLQLRTTGLHTSSIFASTITCPNLQITGNAVFSTINVSSIVAPEATVPLINASTISFEPSLGGVKFPLNLGIGEFLGAAAGTFAGETVTMTLATGALLTGLVGMIAPRTTNNIYPPGEPSTFQTINLQTQLQYSTIGSQVSSFYRFVSSSDGSMGTITPGLEYIVSSIIQPGTLCIRSFSDPMNLANPSTFTSTVQSFGYWVPVPPQISLPFSTVTGDFNVRSTLTAYKANISTSLTVQGAFQAGNVTSLGIVAAGTGITTGGNVTAFGTGSFTSGLTTGGIVSGATLNIIGGGGYIEPFVSTTQIQTFDINADIADITLANITTVNVGSLNAGTSFTTFANTSNINVSSINGLPYTPGGGGGTLGVFSTIFVSSMTNTSSLTVTGNANLASTFTNTISTNILTAGNIGAGQALIGTVSPTLIDDTGIYNPQGYINYGSGNISSIQNNTLWNNTTSTQALFVSTVNGQTYPPPYNSTIIGNFNVTSTMSAHEVFAFGNITSVGNVGAGGNITGAIGAFTQVNSSGPLTATNATIGGVTVGPAGLVVATQVSATNVNLTTINNAAYPPNTAFSTVNGNFNVGSTLTAYSANVSTNIVARGVITAQNSIFATNNITAGGTIQGGNIGAIGQVSGTTLNIGITASIPAITGLNTINGQAYPQPLVSSFQKLFTSSITTSTITTAGNAFIGGGAQIGGNVLATGTVTAGAFSSAGNYNGLSATYPGVNISIAGNGNIIAGGMSANSGTFISTSISSISVSTINGITYPPPLSPFNPNPSYSTVTVSSIVTANQLTANGANIGGVLIASGSQLSANLVTGAQVNAGILNVSTITRAGGAGFPITVTNVIQGTTIRSFNNPWTTFISSVGASACFSAPELYGDYIGSFSAGINSAISFGRPITGASGTSTLTILNGITTDEVFVGSYDTGAVDIVGTSISLVDTLGNETAIEANKTILVSGTGPRTEIFPGRIDVLQTASLTSTIGVQIIGSQVNILTPSNAVAGIVNGGVSQLAGNVTAPTINNQRNITGTYLNGYYYGSRWLDANVPTAPQSFMPLTQSLMASGFYNFGATYAFYSGIPAIVPFQVVSFSPFTPCVMRVLFNTNRNLLGPPGLALLGAWDVVVLWANYSGGPQISITVNTIMSQNVSLSLTPTGAGSIVYLLTLTPNGGFGTPQPRNGRVSWTIQPLEPPIDIDPNPFVP